MSWLKDAVIEGLQTLLVLRFSGAPAADTITAVANVWFGVFSHQPIKWDEKQDRPRIAQAFARGAGRFTSWPAPKEVLELMPPRRDVAKLTHTAPRTMPDNIRALLNAALDRPGAKIARGQLKPSYVIQFYALDGGEMAFNIIAAHPRESPETPLDCLIHNLTDTLGKLGQQLNKPTTIKEQP